MTSSVHSHQPRWFPGYTIAAVSTVALIATAPGQTFIISQLNVPLSEAFNITPLALNTAYTVATIAGALPLVFVGAWADRLGPRRALAVVAGCLALACAATAAVQGAITVFISFFLLRFLGQGALALVSQHALAMWFHRRLGTIQGIKQVVLFAVWIPFPYIAVVLIEHIGWRLTYLFFGVSIALTVIPLALRHVRDRPEDLGLRMDNDSPRRDDLATDGFDEDLPEATGAGPFPGQLNGTTAPTSSDWTLRAALRSRAFWILASVFFLSPMIGTAMLFDMQPILIVRGLPASAAAIPVSVWTATMAIMALPSGILTDRLRPRALIAMGMTLIGLSAAAMWLLPGLWGTAGAMVIFGIGQSIVAASGSAAIARFFGRSHHGAIRASIARIGVIGTGLGPLVSGLSASLSGQYDLAFIGFSLLSLPAIAASLSLSIPRRRAE